MSQYTELLKTDEYWITRIQTLLFEAINDYLQKNKLTKSAFAKQIGVSKGYVTQVLNGDFDHKISTFVRLIRAVDKIPDFNLMGLNEFVHNKKMAQEEGSKIRLIAFKNQNSKISLDGLAYWGTLQPKAELNSAVTYSLTTECLK